MKICVLASGSSGNSTYIETKKNKILIDVGLDVKQIDLRLQKINISFDEINYILITHLHDDHIKALKKMHKETKVYVSKKMKQFLEGINPSINLLTYEDSITIDDVVIKKITTSHDSIDPRGFLIEEDGKSLVYITDTGYINLKWLNVIKNKNIYIMESNHDLLMLREGPYPPWLKQRVSSDRGHLCNEMSATYLSKLIGPSTKKVFLAHLSKENNTPEAALQTFKEKMIENNIDFNNVSCLSQDVISEVIEL